MQSTKTPSPCKRSGLHLQIRLDFLAIRTKENPLCCCCCCCCCCCYITAGVSSLYALLMGHNSDFMASFYAAEEMIGMAVGPWKPGAAGAGCLRSRTAQYTKKLNIPFAPKQCQVRSFSCVGTAGTAPPDKGRLRQHEHHIWHMWAAVVHTEGSNPVDSCVDMHHSMPDQCRCICVLLLLPLLHLHCRCVRSTRYC
jgi:hypothetical protein